METRLRDFVRRRSGDVCEYCRMPAEAIPLVPLHVEHIVAKQHGGDDDPNQLATACDRCNAYKGPNLTSIDSDTGNIVSLFNPRQQTWGDHFTFRNATIVGLTPTGRATVRLLNMNHPRRVELRNEWLEEGGVFV